MTWPILSVILAVPVVGALGVFAVPSNRPRVARLVLLGATAATLGLACVLLVAFLAIPPPSDSHLSGSAEGTSLKSVTGPISFQYQEQVAWLHTGNSLSATHPAFNEGNNAFNQAEPPAINFSYHVGVDGLSVWLIALAALLFFLAAITLSRRKERLRAFAGLMLLSELGVLGVLMSLDLILFYFFWEAALIPLYFLMIGWGDEHRGRAALKFIIYTVAGSLFMLLAIIGVYFISGSQTGVYTFDVPTLIAAQSFVNASQGSVLTVFGHSFTLLNAQDWMFLAFALAFAIKIPLVPFHSWLPDAYSSGDTSFLIFFAGIVSKLGAFGFIRYDLTLFPQASHTFQPLMMGLGVVSILYGALAALAQRDIKRIVAYASISHLGFIVLGIFALNIDGLNGAIIQMINHGIIIAALFICVGVYEARFATRDLRELGGLAKPMPIMAGLFLIAALAGLGMPLLNSFVGEFLTLLGAFQVAPAWAVLASLGMVLACWYMLRLYQGITQGRLRLPHGQVEGEATEAVSRLGRLDAGVVEVAVLAPLVALIIVIGVYPGPVIRYTRFSAGQYIAAVDRAPASTAAPATRAALTPGTARR
ncbi:MAG TPA: NADH-quinone oxidoreductase subunit M [Candidatus Dormibacteraeota bacterium]|nr:NADH-quinone oxidoreductase subunit M [Candidatus Dormibacteraeota bacterium]